MKTIQFFATCLIDTFYPEVGEAILDIFSRLGVTVDFAPDQTCCGQPSFNAGLRADARQIAEHMLRTFEAAPGDIVSPSGSCVHMLRVNYPELFADDPAWLPRARSLAVRTFEFSEYLVDVLGVTDVGARWDGTLTYHPSCHLSRGLGIDHQPRALLAAVQGAQILELPHADECCTPKSQKRCWRKRSRILRRASPPRWLSPTRAVSCTSRADYIGRGRVRERCISRKCWPTAHSGSLSNQLR
jgi:L-lactate dehydrogenase complex protein LldE